MLQPALLIKMLIGPSSVSAFFTAFIMLSSYQIADTSRVFFTRISAKKSPMTADTIHLHHIVIQSSGSYLTTMFVILFLCSVSSFFAIVNTKYFLSQIGLILHLSIIFLFVLTPPAPTYARLLNVLIRPLYSWGRDSGLGKINYPQLFLLSSLQALSLFHCNN